MNLFKDNLTILIGDVNLIQFTELLNNMGFT
jgi:hypothetical protein